MPESVLEKWAFYFKDLPDNKYPEILKQILKDEKEIYMAEEARIKVSLMEKILYSYRGYQRARWDEISRLDYAREQGLAEGMKQTQFEIARKMKGEGIAVVIIERTTALSAEEINKL